MRDFRDLREQLLHAGIAPRHVRRYLAELRQHYDDLIAEEHAHGITGPAAHAAAAARLGSSDELAASVLAKPELRSMTARRPWLVFGILPPLAVIIGFILVVIVVQLVAIRGGAYIPRQGFVQPAPTWLVWTLSGTMFTINFVVVPLLGVLLVWLAQRQRIKPVWPMLGIALLLALSIHGSFHLDAHGRAFRTFGTIIPTHSLFGSGGLVDWPTLLAQATLLCLPLAWLWRSRHTTTDTL